MNRSRTVTSLCLILFFVAAVLASQAFAAQVFVVADDSVAAAEAVARAGGEVHHVFPPHALLVEAPDLAALARLPGIRSVATSEVRSSDVAPWGQSAWLAAEAWNRSLRPRLAPQRTGPRPGPIKNDMRLVPETIAPYRAFSPTRVAAAPYGAGRYEISEYMIGKVAVGIILPESTGSGENWTSPRQSDVVSKIQQAMEWWRLRRPTAHLTFYYDIHLSVSTTYEPIQMSSLDEGLWINDVLAKLGYSDSDYFERCYSYDNAIRNSLNTDWAFAIFVADSYYDTDGEFSDSAFAYAYLGGPFEVMTYKNDLYGIAAMPDVCAHETGHIFFALDEYAGSSSPSERSGYYNTVNGNYEVGGTTNVACIMRGDIGPYESNSVCSYTHEQIGHRDLNSNSIEDVVDVPPETTLNPYSPDPSTQGTLNYTGTCTVVPLQNQNSQDHTLPPPNVTINTIAGVDYRVDGGAWQPATASDGAFDEPQEAFKFTVALGVGTHTIEARARDTAPNVDPTPASDTVTVSASAPQVLGTSPSNGASGVSPSTTLTATFDQAMLASTINTATFIAREGASNWINGTVTYDDTTHVATFTPASGLPGGGTITATILSGASGVQNASGTPMANDCVWSFSTGQPTATLSSGYVTPTSGDASTRFTWRIKYWNTGNLAPSEVWLAIRSAATGSVSWRQMWAYNPSDTTYTDGAWFTYTCYMGGGAYTFRFAARCGAEWAYWPQPAGSYAVGPSVNPVVLSSGYLTPTSGTPATDFTWRVKYWNTNNVAPDVVYVAIWWQSRGTTYWYRMWPLNPADTTYTDGAWYTCSMKALDASGHAFRFAAQQGSNWSYLPLPAGSYTSGPTVTP